MSMVTPDLDAVDVVITLPLAEKFQSRLLELVKQKLDRDMKFNITQDPTIISGIVLRFGSLTLNGSLRYLLQEKGMSVKEKLEKGLLKRGSKK